MVALTLVVLTSSSHIIACRADPGFVPLDFTLDNMKIDNQTYDDTDDEMPTRN
jgi:hypothetical protein